MRSHLSISSTPIELATFEWNQAQNSILIVRHGDDHGTFYGKYVRGHCAVGFNISLAVPGPARMAEIDFLNTGVLPKARNQTLVTIYTSRSGEVPIAEPYTAPIGPLAGDSAKIWWAALWTLMLLYCHCCQRQRNILYIQQFFNSIEIWSLNTAGIDEYFGWTDRIYTAFGKNCVITWIVI